MGQRNIDHRCIRPCRVYDPHVATENILCNRPEKKVVEAGRMHNVEECDWKMTIS
jgi:hypothetical protein